MEAASIQENGYGKNAVAPYNTIKWVRGYGRMPYPPMIMLRAFSISPDRACSP